MDVVNYRQRKKTSLGFFPTPITELKRLAQFLNGPRILMKRDDLTGLYLGGNKTRKLQYLLADAIDRNCDTVITGGSAQSNHCRQTTAATAMCGLECHLALGGDEPNNPTGNLLLDKLCGAKIHWTGSSRKGEKIPEIVERLREQGRKPYVIPYGGSNAIGAIGFVDAVKELREQIQISGANITHIVIPSSSGGTQAGLILGKKLFSQSFDIIGIGIDKGEAGDGPFDQYITNLVHSTATLLECEIDVNPNDIVVRSEFTGKGYGVVGDLEREAIQLAAMTEGVLLDPVYTGRAMGGLIKMIKDKEFSKEDSILFWHTGGCPSLFYYANDLKGKHES